MIRTLSISLGLILATSPCLRDLLGGVGIPPDIELAMSRGGDPRSTTKTRRCDAQGDDTGVAIYVGCSAVGDSCTQCLTANADGSFTGTQYTFISPGNSPSSPGQQEDSTKPKQDCGNKFKGTCINDLTSPTGFACQGGLTPYPCVEYNPLATGPQPPLPPQSSDQ